MPRNEDGEFELVLGNRQLLSVFFLVVILLSIFFLMGYIVGKNSTPFATVDSTPVRTAKPVVVDSPTRTPDAPAEKPAEKPADPPPAPEETAKSEPASKRAEPEQKKPEPKPEKAAEKKAEKAAEKKAAEPATVSSNKPVAGATYLQIAAVDEKAADVMVSTLRQNGFTALSMQVPEKPQLYRVFTGPYKDAGAVADAKAKLTAAGFRGNGAIPKTF